MALYSTDSTMGNPSEIFIIDVRTVDSSFSTNDPILQIPLTNAPKATSMVWGNLDEVVISGHDNGDLAQWDLRYKLHCFNIDKCHHYLFSFSPIELERRSILCQNTPSLSTTCSSPKMEASSLLRRGIALQNFLTLIRWIVSKHTKLNGR